LRLQSFELGLTGRADVVEFHALPDGGQRVFPIEYKRGRPKKHDADRVQLCAEALCLEEMLEQAVPEGALFYGQRQRRQAVAFDDALRERTRGAAARLHELIASGTTPPPVNDARCEQCSLRASCLPSIQRRSARRYLAAASRRARQEAPPA
jgi:CRISPR-associated exonuclease Cas4